MAAALRNVAARLGGRAALQAANVPGRLPTRLVHTRTQTVEERKEGEMRYAKIQALKEEQFVEIAEFRQKNYSLRSILVDKVMPTNMDRRKYYISRMHSWNDEMILYPLSVEIKPRSGDTFRRSCRRTEILNRFFWLLGYIVSIDIAGDGLFWCIRAAVIPERREQLEKKKKMVMDCWKKLNQ